jgi:hypothetical protein
MFGYLRALERASARVADAERRAAEAKRQADDARGRKRTLKQRCEQARDHGAAAMNVYQAAAEEV